MAQYYHVMDYKKEPPELIATLAEGLPTESRTMMHFAGLNYTLNQLLMAAVIDKLQVLIWQRTKDGHKGTHYPESLFEKFATKKEEKDPAEELNVFDSPDAYLEWRRGKIHG